MSVTGRALAIKFLLTFGAAGLILSIFDTNPWSLVFLYSLVVVPINYLVGDMFVFPSMGTIAAAIGDGIMAALVAYLYGEIVVDFQTSVYTLIVLGGMVAAVEFVFNGFLIKSGRVAP
ncbi:MAG: DUF2512 family protein [Firmicutes bacterium]|nr:DUF2512 family protein [Bacillota bacterium]